MMRPSSPIALLFVCGLVCPLSVGCSGADDDQLPDAGEYNGDAHGEDDPVPPIVSPSLWRPLAADDDPLSPRRPAEVDCPSEATKTELLDGDLSFAVNMELCNYLAVAQSSLVELDAGDTVEARIWHFSLTPPIGSDAAQAQVAITVDGQIEWEHTVDIPADGQLLTPQWDVTSHYPQGTEVTLHLQNHGDNEWNVIDFIRLDKN